MVRVSAMWCGLICLVTAAACDLVVSDGQVTVLGNRGSVFAVETPSAVTVHPGGTLIVEDADLFGLGQLVDGPPPGGLFPGTGPAISSDKGTVRIEKGRIVGGNAFVINTSPLPPREPGSPLPLLLARQAGALEAVRSSVDISGGTLMSASLLGDRAPYLPLPVVLSMRGQLRIRGGELLAGNTEFSLGSAGTISANSTRVEITGGNFDAGSVGLANSQTRISGGSFLDGLFISESVFFFLPDPEDLPLPPGCTEIRGGIFSRVQLSTRFERLFIFGSEFNLPLGPVVSPAPEPGNNDPLALRPRRVTGVFADGSPIDLLLVAPPGTQAALAGPDDPGCNLAPLDP